MLQQALDGPFGIDRLPDIHGFAGALITLTFLSYPYVLITVRASLMRLDPALEESARGLGLGPWATFFRVVCPLLRPSIAAGGLLVGLYTLSDFGAVSLLRYETFTWAIFIQYESALDRTLGAGMSLALMILALGWVGLELVSRGRGRYFASSSAPSRPPALVRLGGWRWPAILFCGTVVAISLALPMSILGYWVSRGISAGEPLILVWEAVRNSVYISALAALAAVGVMRWWTFGCRKKKGRSPGWAMMLQSGAATALEGTVSAAPRRGRLGRKRVRGAARSRRILLGGISGAVRHKKGDRRGAGGGVEHHAGG